MVPAAVLGTAEGVSAAQAEITLAVEEKTSSTKMGINLSEVPHGVCNSSETEASLETSSSLPKLNYTASHTGIVKKFGGLLNVDIDFGKLLATTTAEMAGSLKIPVNKRWKFLHFVKEQQAKNHIRK